jgi:hypothetical protein
VLYRHQAPDVELPRADLPAEDAAVPSTWTTWYNRYIVLIADGRYFMKKLTLSDPLAVRDRTFWELGSIHTVQRMRVARAHDRAESSQD